MNIAILASTNNGVAFSPITSFPRQADLLGWCQQMAVGTSILLVLLGLVYMLYGWNMFKPLITVNAALVGIYAGALLGSRYGHAFVGGMLGCLVCGCSTLPLMKWAVAVIGGICGALLGAALWKIAGQDPGFAWAGAMTGLVGFGLLSFILFRGSIIMYTSLQGAVMLVIGILGLLFKYQDAGPRISSTMNTQPFVLPVLVFIPAILGLIYQQTKGGTPAGGGGGGGGAPKK